MEIKLPLRELISKSNIDETSLPNSVLNRQQADRFIDLVIDYSVLLKAIRTSRQNSQKGEINKLNLGDIVTEGASTTSSATRRTPTEAVMKWDMEKYRSAFDLTSDFEEDNLERSAIRDKLINMFTKRIAIDTEIAAIEGDDSLATGDAQTDTNNLLGVNDGFFKIMTDNIPNAQQLDAAGTNTSKRFFYDMKRRIPSRFRVAKPSYIWLVSSSTADKWMLDISDRETSQGDSAIVGVVPGPFGIRMMEVPLFPEDLTFGTIGTDGTKVVLTPLDNLVYFVQREIKIEFDRVPRQDKWEVTIHFRVDFQIEDPNMIVLGNNVSVGGADYTG